MRVSSFKVSNYRSITSAEIDLADMTCLVGPNNEGKSNLLRALSLGLAALVGGDRVRHSSSSRSLRARRERTIRYDSESDRPVDADPRSLTTITIRLELTDEECAAFHELVGHSLNGDLPAQVQFTKRGEPRVQYKKQRVGSQLTEKAPVIGEFLRDRLTFQYVPPIRTAEDAEVVIESLLGARIAALGADEEYLAARAVIDAKTNDVLTSVESDLREVLPRFLPSVTDVHIEALDRASAVSSSLGLRSFVVDDGSATDLTAKGSGVQSLAALALLRHGERTSDVRRHSILAIEEPEAHLHSGALHELKPLLAEISKEQQLIFATHSGVLVPTSMSASTVIVQNNQARTSHSLTEVRDSLGVRLSDNLQSARLVLLGEGVWDSQFWRVVLSEAWAELEQAITAGSLGFEHATGANNLSYQLQVLSRAACATYVVYDSDAEGRGAVNKALETGELIDSDYLFMLAGSRATAELEDLLSPTWVRPILEEQFEASITLSDEDEVWSTRLKRALTVAGKSNTRSVVDRAKERLWSAFHESPVDALANEGREFVSTVAAALHLRLYEDSGK